MARSALTGTRIRERRLAQGLRQSELARTVGISAPYLNLIEHNRRRAGEALVLALAEALEVTVSALAEGAETGLLDGLREAAARPPAGARREAPELHRIEEFVGRFPGWAAVLAEAQSRLDGLEHTVVALSERMLHDPHLSASLHEVLSAATSVRSIAAILAESEDIDPEWRARFHAGLHADSERLAGAAEALVAYLDTISGSEAALSSPQEELEAWLARNGYHLTALEEGAGADAGSVVAAAAELASTEAKRLALAHVARARADARALPLAPFLTALAQIGPDPILLARRFDCAPAPVFRRLASLPPEAAPGLAPGLVICDASGTLTFRRPTAGFPLPRFGGACPLWPLYRALSAPAQPVVARVEVAGRARQRFVTYSYAALTHPEGSGGAQVLTGMMLVLPQPGAEVAGDVLVGSSCRVCARSGCPARREPSLLPTS